LRAKRAAKRTREAGCKPGPDIKAPEKTQQAGQQAGRRTAKPKKNNFYFVKS
jgi:hypothetical protein